MSKVLTQRVSLVHDGLARSYLLHTPPSDDQLPLVIMLHGAGASAEFAAKETGWLQLADAERFAVVYPEGLAIRPEKNSKFLTNPQEWNDGSGRGRHDDVGFLTAVLDHLSNRIDPRRVFVTGFSNGAAMTFRFAAERSHRIAAIAPVSGHCWVDTKPSRTVPTFYLIGDSDPLAPIAAGMVRTPWGKIEHRPAVANTLKRWGEAIGHSAGSDFFPVKVIPNLGHHWPGGLALLGETLGGPTSNEVNATSAIWYFFQRHI
jgi:polyhydroxybutyrate depolymerase